MSRIAWSFAPGGFNVTVNAPNGMASTLSGDTPTDDISISILSHQPGADTAPTVAASTATSSTSPMVINTVNHQFAGSIIVHSPVEFRAALTFADDGSMEAVWYSSLRGGISGKGSGKGLGKNTIVRNA